MSDRVVFDPDLLGDHGVAAADATDELRQACLRHDDAIDRVLATGDPATWDPRWLGTTGANAVVAAAAGDLERLGAFASWLAGQVRDLDQDDHGLVQVDLGDLGVLAPGTLLSERAREGLADRVAAWTRGEETLDEADWATAMVLAADPVFAAAMVAATGGPTGLVDALATAHDRLAPGDPPAPGDDPGAEPDGSGQAPELARLAVVLGSALGAATRRGDWTTDDTDGLVAILRAEPGDDDFVPGRAAVLAILVAGAEHMRPAVVARLVTEAVSLERAGGGQAAWDRRATGPDTGLWPRPLLDHTGRVTTDVLSTLLVALERSPGADLAVFTRGVTVPGPDGAPGPVDAELSHLVLDHDFDDVGWARLGAVLEATIIAHRGRDAAGRAAASLSAQSISLVSERIRTTGDLPRAFQPGATAVLADAMPAAVPALAGRDPATWLAAGSWTFVDAGIHPPDEPVQPAVHVTDVDRIVHRLGSNLPAMERLATAAIATIDLGVRRATIGSRPDVDDLREAAVTTGRGTARLLSAGRAGVTADHAEARGRREQVAQAGEVIGLGPGPAAVIGPLVSAVAGQLVFEPAVPGDYDRLDREVGHDLDQQVRDAIRDAGWLDDTAPEPGPTTRSDGADAASDDHDLLRDIVPDLVEDAGRAAFARALDDAAGD